MATKTKYKGVYYDEIHNSYYVNSTFKTQEGRTVKKCKRGFATAKKANDWKNQYSVEVKNDMISIKKGSLDSILINYIGYKSDVLKPTSLKTIKATLKNHFLPNMPNRIEHFKISDIFKLHEYVSELPNKPTGKNHIISTFKNFVEWLELSELVNSTFAKKFKIVFTSIPTAKTRMCNFLDIEEYKRFINTFTKANNNEFYALLFNVLFFTGGRLGEVLGLKYSNIDFDKCQITFNSQITNRSRLEKIPKDAIIIGSNVEVPYTKTNSIKYVTVPQWLLDKIKVKQTFSESDYVFMYKGNIIDRTTVSAVFKRHLSCAGLPKVRLHDLRHSHTTLLYESGCDAKYVAERLGHSSEKTSLEIYKHLTKDRKQVNDDIVSNFSL